MSLTRRRRRKTKNKTHSLTHILSLSLILRSHDKQEWGRIVLFWTHSLERYISRKILALVCSRVTSSVVRGIDYRRRRGWDRWVILCCEIEKDNICIRHFRSTNISSDKMCSMLSCSVPVSKHTKPWSCGRDRESMRNRNFGLYYVFLCFSWTMKQKCRR